MTSMTLMEYREGLLQDIAYEYRNQNYDVMCHVPKLLPLCKDSTRGRKSVTTRVLARQDALPEAVVAICLKRQAEKSRIACGENLAVHNTPCPLILMSTWKHPRVSLGPSNGAVSRPPGWQAYRLAATAVLTQLVNIYDDIVNVRAPASAD